MRYGYLIHHSLVRKTAMQITTDQIQGDTMEFEGHNQDTGDKIEVSTGRLPYFITIGGKHIRDILKEPGAWSIRESEAA